MMMNNNERPNAMSYVKDRIVEMNEEINSLHSTITQTATASIFLRALLRRKAAEALENGKLEASLLEKFHAHNEAKIESWDDLAPKPTNNPEFFVDKEEFLSEVTTIYEGELVGTVNDTSIPTAIAFNEDAVAVADKIESFSLNITLNEKQLHAKEMALAGKSFCLIGAAGTGKTTAQRAVAEALLDDSRLGASTFKTYDADGNRKYITAPSIAFVAYTRRAASNLRKAIHMSPLLEEELKNNIMTIHSLLEYEPETYYDPIELKDKFRFVPRRNASNPLNITHLIIEESSMVGAHDLWLRVYEALPVGVQIILIGDINQLPPVFGPSILNYALVTLPVVELTQGYRNQGIVLTNAWNILEGKPIVEDANYRVVRSKSKTQAGQQKLSFAYRSFFEALYMKPDHDGEPEYDPEDCMILSPWNKQLLGTDNMNKHIAQFLGVKRKAIVHEILAGMNKVYLAVGDKVMFNKRDGVITVIEKNVAYFGKAPQLPGSDLSRFGVRVLGEGSDSLDDITIDYSSFSLDALEAEKAERKQQASHVVTITYEDKTWEQISATGDFGTQVFSLGYVLTVHKAQGSEWRKVFIILHKDFAVSLYRELFYTAATRARTKVTLLAPDQVIEKAIKNQRIKGDTLKDKLEYFNSGADLRDSVEILKVR